MTSSPVQRKHGIGPIYSNTSSTSSTAKSTGKNNTVMNSSYQLPSLASTAAASQSATATASSIASTIEARDEPSGSSTCYNILHKTLANSSTRKDADNETSIPTRPSSIPTPVTLAGAATAAVTATAAAPATAPATAPVSTSTTSTTLKTNSTPSTSSAYRPLNVKDALSYLDQVKIRFGDRPDVYNRFLDIMKDFKSQSIDTPGVIERVSSLFQGHPTLISGFNTFLPPGYCIECSTDPRDADLIRVTTPSGTITTSTNSSNNKRFVDFHPQHIYHNRPPAIGMPVTNSMYHASPYSPLRTTSTAHPHNQQPMQQHALYHYPQHHPPPLPSPTPHPPPPPPPAPSIATPGTTITGSGTVAVAGTGTGTSAGPTITSSPGSITSLPSLPIRSHQQHGLPPHQSSTSSSLQQQHLHPSLPTLTTSQKVANNGSSTISRDNTQSRLRIDGQGQPQTATTSATAAITGTATQPTADVKRPTVDFNNAINYVNKIKNRFADDPDAYKQFLEVLQTYQKEEQKIEHVYAHVQRLFYGHSDLLDEFQQFLPEVGELHGNKRGMSNSTSSPFNPPSKKKRGVNKKNKQGLETTNSYEEEDRYMKRTGYASNRGFDPNSPSISMEEVELFEQIRKHIGNKPSYEVFLKLLNLYSQDIIDLDTLMERTSLFLGNKPELLDWFKSIIGYDTPMATSTTLFNTEKSPSQVVPKPDLVRCDTVVESPSYRLVPKEWQRQSCSGRDNLCWEVLNDSYVSHPIWASEDSAFVASKKNPYEEAMHRCEEERYEYDLNIDANLNSIALLEPIVKRLETMSLEEQEMFTLTPGLGGQTVSIYERIIKKIYGVERGTEVIQMLYSDPVRVAPVVIKRLKQKDEEWTKGQREWNKVWREIDEKNYYKSLDYQGLTFKTSERKTLTARYLLNEIESIYQNEEDDDDMDNKDKRAIEQQPNKPKHRASPVNSKRSDTELVYSFDDPSIFRDVSFLILCYMDHQNGFSKTDCDKMRHFLQDFIPSFFHADDVIPHECNESRQNSQPTNSTNDTTKLDSKSNQNGNEEDEDEEMDEVDNRDDDKGDDTNRSSSPSEDNFDADRGLKFGKNGRRRWRQQNQSAQHLQQQAHQRHRRIGSRASSRTRNTANIPDSLIASVPAKSCLPIIPVAANDCNSSSSKLSNESSTVERVERAESVDGSVPSEFRLSSHAISPTASPATQPAAMTNPSSPTTLSPISDAATFSLSSTDEGYHIKQQLLHSAASLTLPKLYRPNITSLFGNAHIYCFLRLYQILFGRLAKMKRLGEKAENDAKQHQFNRVAEKLGFRSSRFNDIDISQGHYKALIEQIDRFFDSDVDIATFEEVARYLYTTEAYVLFNVDKLVHALVKQIQTLIGDEKSLELLSLYQDDAQAATSTTYRPLSIYCNKAENIIGQNEHLFKFDFDMGSQRLYIRLLGQEEAVSGFYDQHEDYLASFMDWNKVTQGISTRMISKTSLKRNMKLRPLEDVVMKNELQYRIDYDTYRLSCEVGSEDLLCWPASVTADERCSTSKHMWENALLSRAALTFDTRSEKEARQLLVGKNEQNNI